MTGNAFNSCQQPASFGPDHCDAAECRRLRLALGLNAERMAMVAAMPGRWAWLSVENGYEPIDPGRWARCLAEIDNRAFFAIATPQYHFDFGASRQPAAPRL